MLVFIQSTLLYNTEPLNALKAFPELLLYRKIVQTKVKTNCIPGWCSIKVTTFKCVTGTMCACDF